jgi:hypothetical protein
MIIPRSADTDSTLANEVYDQAVEFYQDHLNSIKNLFVDNEDEDMDLVVLDLDMHWDDAIASLNSMPPSDMFDFEEVSRIIDHEVKTYSLAYSDEDLAHIKKRFTADIRCQRDSIFKGAVSNYIDELEIELEELQSRSKVTEAKGEWIA